jgi:hypothetical protein
MWFIVVVAVLVLAIISHVSSLLPSPYAVSAMVTTQEHNKDEAIHLLLPLLHYFHNLN